MLTTALGAADPGRVVGARLMRLAADAGCVAFLGVDGGRWGQRGRLHHHRMDATDPLRAEWVTALVSPYASTVLAARREDGHPSRWRLAITHAKGTAEGVTAQLLARLP